MTKRTRADRADVEIFWASLVDGLFAIFVTAFTHAFASARGQFWSLGITA